MPLDHGATEAARRFETLDSFTQGYIEAMFFTSTGHAEDENLEYMRIMDAIRMPPMSNYAKLAELAEETWSTIETDCHKFQDSLPEDEHSRTWLDLAYDYAPNHYDEAGAGRDFWYTRNHLGVGFWDRDIGLSGDRLTEHAHTFRECYLYRGDDNLLYLEA